MDKHELVNSVCNMKHTIQDIIQPTKLFYSYEINIDDTAYWAVIGMFVTLFVSIFK